MSAGNIERDYDGLERYQAQQQHSHDRNDGFPLPAQRGAFARRLRFFHAGILVQFHHTPKSLW